MNATVVTLAFAALMVVVGLVGYAEGTKTVRRQSEKHQEHDKRCQERKRRDKSRGVPVERDCCEKSSFSSEGESDAPEHHSPDQVGRTIEANVPQVVRDDERRKYLREHGNCVMAHAAESTVRAEA